MEVFGEDIGDLLLSLYVLHFKSSKSNTFPDINNQGQSVWSSRK